MVLNRELLPLLNMRNKDFIKYFCLICISVFFTDCKDDKSTCFNEVLYSNGVIKARIYCPIGNGQQRYQLFDSSGVIMQEFYVKNGKYDSLIVSYKNGKIYSVTDVKE